MVLYHPNNVLGINNTVDLFLHDINCVLDKHAPLKKLSNKEYKLKSKPWLTHGILKSIRKRDKLLHQYMKEKKEDKKKILQNKYKQYKNKITTLIRSSKSAYYKWYFKENSSNIKKLWKGINEIVNTKTNISSSHPKLIEVKDKGVTSNVTEPTKIATSFNQYFTSIADDILKERKFEGNRHHQSYLKSIDLNSFLIKTVTQSEVERVILELITSKSCGPNSIPTKMLKDMVVSLSQPIKNICNKSFQSGIFPDKLKISKVIPIHKKDSKTVMSNYRPISLLSNISKIMEKLMFSRLYKYLEAHDLIYELQFGFRAKHSTNHALMAITQQIKLAIQNNEIAIGIFVDLQKAFDTVNHEILIAKLSAYGVKGIPNMWFASYLSNRKQYVSINDMDFSIQKVNHGVPQGSILGPLLFTLYINDLHNCIRSCSTFHFADDTNLLYIPRKCNNRCIRRINNDLKSLTHWLLANKISLNIAKTEVVFFRKKSTILPECVKKMKLNGKKLIPSSEIKYLGILLDEHMTFSPHIQKVNAQLNRANTLLAKARYYMPMNLLMQLYYGQFFSRISYGCQIWGQALNDKSHTFILQKKAVRIITFSDFHSHTSPLFKSLISYVAQFSKNQ